MVEEIISVNSRTVSFLNFGSSDSNKDFNSISETKVSFFNVSDKTNGGDFIVFNTLCNSLFRFSESDFFKMMQGDCEDSQFKILMLKNGFWVKNEVDEKKLYIEFANKTNISLKRPLNLTITTTLKCNTRCKYCYEAGVVQRNFSDDKFERLIDFIKEKLCGRNFDGTLKFNIFGGEPLVNEEFIERFCHRLSDENIPFTSYMITNGSLITPEIIKKMKQWNVKDIQITLDGTSENYAILKNYIYPTGDVFGQVMQNIKLLSESGVFVHIRMNISKNNVPDIIELTSYLNKELDDYSNVTFYPAFLMGVDEEFSEEEKVEVCYSLLKKLSNLDKIPSSDKFFAAPRIHCCMKGDPNSFVVDINGDVFKCEHDVGVASKKIGTLENLFMDSENLVKLPSEKCLSCVFLPKCFGGCSAAQEKGEDFCFIEKYMIEAYMKLF